MATDYFSTDHFKLLNKWKGQKRDDSNPEQNQAYEELRKAYFITESWAKLVQERLYPNGYIEVRKRPTNQANVFSSYNWAKIYPKMTSPKMLAYTVGIDSDQQFVVKMDTVQAEGTPQRRIFEALRGPYNNESPVTAILSAAKGLELSMAELADWSVDTIKKFKLSYDEVVKELGLNTEEEPAKPVATEEVPEIEHTPVNKI